MWSLSIKSKSGFSLIEGLIAITVMVLGARLAMDNQIQIRKETLRNEEKVTGTLLANSIRHLINNEVSCNCVLQQNNTVYNTANQDPIELNEISLYDPGCNNVQLPIAIRGQELPDERRVSIFKLDLTNVNQIDGDIYAGTLLVYTAKTSDMPTNVGDPDPGPLNIFRMTHYFGTQPTLNPDEIDLVSCTDPETYAERSFRLETIGTPPEPTLEPNGSGDKFTIRFNDGSVRTNDLSQALDSALRSWRVDTDYGDPGITGLEDNYFLYAVSANHITGDSAHAQKFGIVASINPPSDPVPGNPEGPQKPGMSAWRYLGAIVMDRSVDEVRRTLQTSCSDFRLESPITIDAVPQTGSVAAAPQVANTLMTGMNSFIMRATLQRDSSFAFGNPADLIVSSQTSGQQIMKISANFPNQYATTGNFKVGVNNAKQYRFEVANGTTVQWQRFFVGWEDSFLCK